MESLQKRVQGHIDDIMAKINDKHVYFGNFTGSGALATRSKVLSSRKHMLFLDKYLAQYQQRGTRKVVLVFARGTPGQSWRCILVVIRGLHVH